MKTEIKEMEWKTLPMELMSSFTNCLEWCLMERIWFKSNHNDRINLNYLNQTTPIKSRGSLLDVLDRLVIKGWITKTPIGDGKHNKYNLNKNLFTEWMKNELNEKVLNRTSKLNEKVLNKTSESLKPDFRKSEIRPEEVLNKTGKGLKQDHIDNLDNFPDNFKDNNIDNQKNSEKAKEVLLLIKEAQDKISSFKKEPEQIKQPKPFEPEKELTPENFIIWSKFIESKNLLFQERLIPTKKAFKAFQEELRKAEEFHRNFIETEVLRKLGIFRDEVKTKENNYKV